jgi:coproporphyrinogen III oxidase-like Fe-S oxidoreductase
MNPTTSVDYTAAVAARKRVWNRMFVYRPHDQKVLWLTRRLAALDIDRGRYRALFGTDPVQDFLEEVTACRDAGLLTTDALSVRPTPKGMFYADAVAALLAVRAIRINRDLGPAVIGKDAPAGLLHDTRENDARGMSMG